MSKPVVVKDLECLLMRLVAMPKPIAPRPRKAREGFGEGVVGGEIECGILENCDGGCGGMLM